MSQFNSQPGDNFVGSTFTLNVIFYHLNPQHNGDNNEMLNRTIHSFLNRIINIIINRYYNGCPQNSLDEYIYMYIRNLVP